MPSKRQTRNDRWQQHSTDRFDNIAKPDRVGSHRAVERAGSAGTRFLVAALATLALIAIGVLFVTFQPRGASFVDELLGEEEITAPGPIIAQIDPDTTVVVLNGSGIDGLAFEVDEIINAEGWGKIIFSGETEDRDVSISAVFYSDPEDESFAKGLGEQLGGISYYQSDTYVSYKTQLTVLLGTDYAGPGKEEALAAEQTQPEEGTEGGFDPDVGDGLGE